MYKDTKYREGESMKRIIYFLIGLIFAILGFLNGATAFGAICYTNAILIIILLEINTTNTGDAK